MNQQQYLARFKEILDEMLDLTTRKNHDYAGENNPFANFELIDKLTQGDTSVAEGFLVRMSDKLQRVANLIKRENQVKDEKITDTLRDLAVYSILFEIYLEENGGSHDRTE